MTTTNRRQALAVLAAASSLAIAPALRAQAAFPSKTIRLVVPFGAGGIADLTARTVGQKLGEVLGQSVVIENKPGAGGIGAAESVVRAEPDGHTLFLMSNGTAVSAGLFKSLPFDPQKDFAPVSLIGLFDLVVLVPDNSKFKTLADLLAHAKANPGKLNLATINIGSTQNLAAELFKTTAGIQAQVVPFNGTPAVVTAMRGGQVDAAIEILGPVRSQIVPGGLRALAVLGDTKSALLPNVATVADSGGALKGFDVASWNAIAAPGKTPRDVVAKLNGALKTVLADAELRRKLAELGVEARHSTPEQLGSLLASETRRWGEVITSANIPRQ